MELGAGSSSSSSSSSASSSSATSSDSLNGLKFGQKIYFEAAGGGGQAKPAESAGRPPPPRAAKKGRSGVVQGGGQPPRCQVEGCKVDLSDAKPYYSRHKVCGTHSKSPTVIVAGLEQRFCQQCSRFHRLPEFDQGKRSCRRRLAGHNERRRKPPPGSFLSTRYGNSSFIEATSRTGSFLMDFSAFTARNSWPNARTSGQSMCNQPTAAGKLLQHPWQSNHEKPPPELLMQGSAARGTYVGASTSSGECFAGVSDSSRALSLLSTQPWGSTNQCSSHGVNGLTSADATLMVHPSGSHGEAVNHSSSTLWGFRGVEDNSNSHENPPDQGLGQLSQPASSQYSEDLIASQHNGRKYPVLEHSRGYSSSFQNMHWSL